jgi:hypothetical protein
MKKHPCQGIKRLVLNMVNTFDSGKALMRLETDSGKAFMSSRPLFLREVGKYYWNEKQINTVYNSSSKWVQNFKTFATANFLIPRKSITEYNECGDWVLKNGYFRALKYFKTEWVIARACELGINITKFIREKWIDIDPKNLVFASHRCDLEMTKCVAERCNRGYDFALYTICVCPAPVQDRLEKVKFLYSKKPNPVCHNRCLRELFALTGEEHLQVLEYLLSDHVYPLGLVEHLRASYNHPGLAKVQTRPEQTWTDDILHDIFEKDFLSNMDNDPYDPDHPDFE